MTFEIRVDFNDNKGTIISETLEITPPDSIDENNIESYLVDSVNVWFYTICRQTYDKMWRAQGGGSEDIYDIGYEKYLEQVEFHVDWEP